jgi:dCMP deaminase
VKDKFVKFYFKVASEASDLSHARRLKVGAVIVKDDSILSYGYNGTPGGFDNNCENEEYRNEIDDRGNHRLVMTGVLVTKPEVIHAEINAIAKAAKKGYSCHDATMFITHAPCVECAKLICQSGISKIYYKETYRSTYGLDLLYKKGIEIIHYD